MTNANETQNQTWIELRDENAVSETYKYICFNGLEYSHAPHPTNKCIESYKAGADFGRQYGVIEGQASRDSELRVAELKIKTLQELSKIDPYKLANKQLETERDELKRENEKLKEYKWMYEGLCK